MGSAISQERRGVLASIPRAARALARLAYLAFHSAAVCTAAIASITVAAEPRPAEPVPRCIPASAYQEEWRWTNFTEESGLPMGRVERLLQAQDGTVWAQLADQLAWFEGFSWVSLDASAGPVLREGTLAAPAPEALGGILVISDQRLFRADRGGFEAMDLPPGPEGALRVLGVAAEGTDGLLIQTVDQGMFHLRGGVLQSVALPEEAVRAAAGASSLVQIGDGTSWWLGFRGLWQWSDGLWQARSDMQAQLLFTDTHGTRLAVCSGARPGLWEWSDSGEVQHRGPRSFLDHPGAVAVAPSGDALAVFLLGDVLVREEGRWNWLNPKPPQLVTARQLLFERQGDLWCATDHGLFLCRRTPSRWQCWDDIGPQVNALMQARNGDFWIGTGSGLVVRRKDGPVERISSIGGRPIAIVTGVAEDASGAVWVSSGEAFSGAYRCLGGQWQHVDPTNGESYACFHRILPDRSGHLWFLGVAPDYPSSSDDPEPGAFKYVGESFERWGVDQGLVHNRVYDFEEGPDGALWFGTWGGLSRWQGGAWTHWTQASGLRISRVFTLALAPDGCVWLGHQHRTRGLGCVRPDGTVRYYTTQDGLVDDRIWELQFDNQGRLWIASGDGLACWQNEVFSSFGRHAGLSHPYIWPVLPTSEGVYVGAQAGGVYMLDFDEALNPPPRVRLEAMSVAGDKAVLAWDALAFRGEVPPALVETRSRLDDGEWSSWGLFRRENLAGLAAGEHRMEVQAKSFFGRVSSPAVLDFKVAPPWFRHPVFVAGVGAWLALLGVGAVLAVRRRRVLQRHRREVDYQLQQSQRMEAVGVLAAGLGHDINNLMTTILGYADRAQALGRRDPQVTELIDNIHEVAEEAAGVTRSLLTFCRRSPSARQRVDLGAIVAESSELLRRMLPAQIRVECRAAPAQAVHVEADPSQIRQVLLNLAFNARDAMPTGGELRLTLGCRAETDGAASPALARAEHHAVLTVEDNGAGMSAAVHERAFEPFFTTKPRARGTGLGLAVVHGIVTGHGGSVRIETAEGRGTCVTVLLPCCS
jgi:signal transduction histidine kinase